MNNIIAVYFKNDYSNSDEQLENKKIIEEFSINIINKEDTSDFLEKYKNNYLILFNNLNVAKCYTIEKTIELISNIVSDMKKYKIDCVELSTIVQEYELGTIKNTLFSTEKSDVCVVTSNFFLKEKGKRYYSGLNLFI